MIVQFHNNQPADLARSIAQLDNAEDDSTVYVVVEGPVGEIDIGMLQDVAHQSGAHIEAFVAGAEPQPGTEYFIVDLP